LGTPKALAHGSFLSITSQWAREQVTNYQVEVKMAQKITPFLWFDKEAEEAMNFMSLFSMNLRIKAEVQKSTTSPVRKRDRYTLGSGNGGKSINRRF
jgi:hypothetical protein